MAENLERAQEELSRFLPEEIIDAYRQTTFSSPSSLERSIDPFLTERGVGFRINEYAEFLDQGTAFIQGQSFLSDVLDDGDGGIEEILTLGFEKDIDESIENTAKQGGATIT